VNVTELSPLSGNPEGSFEINYRPLLITSQPVDALLTIHTKELGSFTYNMVLTAAPLISRKTVRFEVPLGSTHTESFVFQTFNTVKAEFSCAVSKPQCLSVQKVRSYFIEYRRQFEICLFSWEVAHY
jgi:hypothetical protein